MTSKNNIAAGILVTSLIACGQAELGKNQPEPKNSAPVASSPAELQASIHNEILKPVEGERMAYTPVFSKAIELCQIVWAREDVPTEVDISNVDSWPRYDSYSRTFSVGRRFDLSKSVQYVLDGEKVEATCIHQKFFYVDENWSRSHKPGEHLTKYASNFRQLDERRPQQLDLNEYVGKDGHNLYRDGHLQERLYDISAYDVDGIVDATTQALHGLIPINPRDWSQRTMRPFNEIVPTALISSRKKSIERLEKVQKRFVVLVNGGIEQIAKGKFTPLQKDRNGGLKPVEPDLR